MNADDLRTRVTTLSQWKRANEGGRWLPCAVVEERVPGLLREFGPRRAQADANYPFWRLQTDGIWTVRDAERFTHNSSGDVSVSQLRSADTEAGFSDETYRLLKQQPGLLGDLVGRILNTHFPETIHDDIRQALAGPAATRASANWC